MITLVGECPKQPTNIPLFHDRLLLANRKTKSNLKVKVSVKFAYQVPIYKTLQWTICVVHLTIHAIAARAAPPMEIRGSTLRRHTFINLLFALFKLSAYSQQIIIAFMQTSFYPLVSSAYNKLTYISAALDQFYRHMNQTKNCLYSSKNEKLTFPQATLHILRIIARIVY